MIEISRSIVQEQYLSLTRETAIAHLSAHDPEADFADTSDADLATIYAATLNDYPNAAFYENWIESCNDGDIVKADPFSGWVSK